MSGIVLAGGRSSRFGSDKLSARYRGQPLLTHAVDALRGVCDEVIVVIAPGAPDPGLREVRIARDAVPGEGPLAGTLAGSQAASWQRACVVGGDMPGVAPVVLSALLDRLEAEQTQAAALQDGDRMRPLPCAVRTDAALAVGRELFDAGERSLRALLQALGAAIVDEASWTALDPERRTLFDVDEPGDLPPT